MKSIGDTLKFVDAFVIKLKEENKVWIALIGGYAVIAHGVERTTRDVDFCIYTESLLKGNSAEFIKNFNNALPEGFSIKVIEGSKSFDDPFKHDVIFLQHRKGDYPRMDFIVAKYKWEFEGIKKAKPLNDISFPVLPRPYLIAMKLKAGGIKDDYDIVELYKLLKPSEKRKVHKLAKLIHQDKNLLRLLKPRQVSLRDDKDLLI